MTVPPRRLLTDTVRGQILEPILDGSLPVATKLAAEPELSAQCGVSRATLREAVRGLVEEGYLSRVHGSGTYVAFRPNLRHSIVFLSLSGRRFGLPTEEGVHMKVFVAAEATGGKDDFSWTVPGELVHFPQATCDCPDCECERAMAGLVSRKATTCFVVRDLDLDPPTYTQMLFDNLRDGGWVTEGSAEDLSVRPPYVRPLIDPQSNRPRWHGLLGHSHAVVDDPATGTRLYDAKVLVPRRMAG